VGCRSLRRSRLPASLHLRWKLRLQQGTCYPSSSDRDNYPRPMGGCRCTSLCSDGPSDYPLGRCNMRLFSSSPYILLVAPVRTLRKRLSLSRCLTSAAWLVEPRSGGYHHFQSCVPLCRSHINRKLNLVFEISGHVKPILRTIGLLVSAVRAAVLEIV
jgi:hypothetical protein